MDVRDWIKNKRKEMNWSRTTLAVLLGVSITTVNNWEQGRTSPGPYARSRLKETFGELPE